MELAEENLGKHHLDEKEVVDVVVRFAGDSGDGMQLTGNNFTEATALYGNDLSTFPDFPAEIRAPVGATFGVSAFQIYFGANDVTTAGDALDVLVVMNPAALITNVDNLVDGGLLIVDSGAFTAKNLTKAKYQVNPLEDGSLNKFRVLEIDITKQVWPPSPSSISVTKPECVAKICGLWGWCSGYSIAIAPEPSRA